MAGAVHRKHVLEQAERNLRNATIQIRNAAVEDADDRYDGGSEGSVAAGAQQGQLVANTDTEISCQYPTDDDLRCVDTIKKATFLDKAWDVRHAGLECRLYAVDLNPVASFLARSKRECSAACRDVLKAGIFTIRRGQLLNVRHTLTHLQVIFVTRRLHLQMTAKRLQRIVDHKVVHAELQRDHEHEERIGEHHRPGRQPGASRVPPDVTPGQTQNDIHGLLTGITEI